MPDLASITERARADLQAKYDAREQALKLAREIIRLSANSIRATHRHEYDQARELFGQATQSRQQIQAALTTHPDVLYAGFVHDADKEYAEAALTLAMVEGSDLPAAAELGVDTPAYLNGLGEAASELRREILDMIRHGEMERSETLLAMMDEVYASLVTMDFPDGMTGGLRRTTDLVRGVLERTRGDLTMAARQRDLERTLATFERRLAR